MARMDRMVNNIFDKDRLELKVMDREGIIIFVYGLEVCKEYQDRVENLKICMKS